MHPVALVGVFVKALVGSAYLAAQWRKEREMEPIALAGLAVTALVQYIGAKAARLAGRAGRDVDHAVDDRIDRLYRMVRDRVSGDPSAARTLRQLEERPNNARQQGRLENALEVMLEHDRMFAAELEAAVAELSDRPFPGQTTIRDAGAVAMGGGDVRLEGTYVAGRDLTIGQRGT